MGPPPTLPGKNEVKRMLAVFGILAIAGVLLLAFSVVIGLGVLVVAEAFFMVAYRRFKRASPSS